MRNTNIAVVPQPETYHLAQNTCNWFIKFNYFKCIQIDMNILIKILVEIYYFKRSFQYY